jgi:guanylate kinase
MKSTMSILPIHPFDMTHAELVRVSLTSELLAQVIPAVNIPFSLAVCGSVAFGQAHDSSDIELFFVVENTDIRAFVESAIFTQLFNVSYPSTVLAMVENGLIEALRMPEITYQGFTLSTNIYTKNLCTRISQLDSGVVKKYRQTAKTELDHFRGFDWHYTGATVARPSNCYEYADGFVSAAEIMHVVNGNSYFHIYVDKFIGAFLLWDDLHIRTAQVNLYNQLGEQCRKSSHMNPLGFMYKITSATSSQIQRITEQRIIHAQYDRQIAEMQSALVQISGPTGVGKDTIISLLLQINANYAKIPCITTRMPRTTEVEEYTFITVEDFLAMIRQEKFFFWHYNGRDYAGNMKLYGILYDDIMSLINRQCLTIIFSIGGEIAARFLHNRYPTSTSIWLQPESIRQLVDQICQRQGTLDAEMCNRLEKLTQAQLIASPYFDASVSNKPNCIDETLTRVQSILYNNQHKALS